MGNGSPINAFYLTTSDLTGPVRYLRADPDSTYPASRKIHEYTAMMIYVTLNTMIYCLANNLKSPYCHLVLIQAHFKLFQELFIIITHNAMLCLLPTPYYPQRFHRRRGRKSESHELDQREPTSFGVPITGVV